MGKNSGKSTASSSHFGQTEETCRAETRKVSATESTDEAPSAASERDVRSAGLRTDRANRGAAQLRVHHGRHGERHHLLRAGEEQEGGEEGGRHLCSGGIVQRAL